MIPKDSRRKAVLILHRIPYEKVRYNEIIDHEQHDVYYVVTGNEMDISSDIPCTILRVSEAHYVEEVICTVFQEEIKVDTVIALSEYSLINGELIRSALGLKIDFSSKQSRVIYNCRDKRLMKKCLKVAGIRVARTLLATSLLNPRKKLTRLIAKPAYGASSC